MIMILEMTMTIFYGELRLLTHGQLTDLSLTLCTPKPQYWCETVKAIRQW